MNDRSSSSSGSRNILISGATGAVGSELVRLASSGGLNVIGLYYLNEKLAKKLAAIQSVRMLACDLTDAEQVKKLLSELPANYCPDVLVNLAASKLEICPMQRIDWDEYQRQIDGVLKSVVLLTQPLLKRMLKNGGGRIISALSAVVLDAPPRGFASYTVAKYALAGYMKCIASEFADRGIKANMVSPGPMETKMLKNLPTLMTDQMRASIPGGEWISPQTVARSVFWLATEAGLEVTGCNIPITSGSGI